MMDRFVTMSMAFLMLAVLWVGVYTMYLINTTNFYAIIHH